MISRVVSASFVQPNHFQKRRIHPGRYLEKTFIPPVQLFAIPGFGPVTFTVAIAPLIYEGFNFLMSDGPNVHRLIKIPSNQPCYQSHPLALHGHTVTLDDFPKKSKVLNAFNRAVNHVGLGFQDYVKRCENFYQTINGEAKACTDEYYKLLTQDSIRSAWLLSQYQGEYQKALQVMDQVTQILKGKQRFSCYQIMSKELISAYAYVLHHLGDEKGYQKACAQSRIFPSSDGLSKQTLTRFGQMMVLFSKELSKDTTSQSYDVADLLVFWAQKSEASPKEYPLSARLLNRIEGGEHLKLAMQGFFDNLDLLQHLDQLSCMPHYLEYSFKNSKVDLDYKTFKAICVDLILSLPPSFNEQQALEYSNNNAKMAIGFYLFQAAQKDTFKLIESRIKG